MAKQNVARGIGIGILAGFGFVALVTLVGFVVQALWNWLAPELFGLPVITFWQSLGLLVLTRILFGGMGGPGRPGKHRGGRRGPGKPPWALSPDEREHLERAGESQPDEVQAS